jgi:uncharacterized phage-associated protein
MASVHDVAAHILEEYGSMTALRLQRLVYYAQAWHLVWEDEPLFAERIEAWANGPIVPALYRRHKGKLKLQRSPGDPGRLTQGQLDSIEAVLDFYGSRTTSWLTELAQLERPWRDARRGIPPGERGEREIGKAALAEYYGSLLASAE